MKKILMVLLLLKSLVCLGYEFNIDDYILNMDNVEATSQGVGYYEIDGIFESEHSTIHDIIRYDGELKISTEVMGDSLGLYLHKNHYDKFGWGTIFVNCKSKEEYLYNRKKLESLLKFFNEHRKKYKEFQKQRELDYSKSEKNPLNWID